MSNLNNNDFFEACKADQQARALAKRSQISIVEAYRRSFSEYSEREDLVQQRLSLNNKLGFDTQTDLDTSDLHQLNSWDREFLDFRISAIAPNQHQQEL